MGTLTPQRDLVAHAAGGVLVDLGAGDGRQVEHVAGAEHGLGEGQHLGRGHAAEEDRHAEGGQLGVGDLAGGEAADQPLELGAGERPAVALPVDQLVGPHAVSSPRPPPLTR
jgi:hypothetical protein